VFYFSDFIEDISFYFTIEKKSNKIFALTLAFIIITMAIIPGYSITKNFSQAVYAQTPVTRIDSTDIRGVK